MSQNKSFICIRIRYSVICIRSVFYISLNISRIGFNYCRISACLYGIIFFIGYGFIPSYFVMSRITVYGNISKLFICCTVPMLYSGFCFYDISGFYNSYITAFFLILARSVCYDYELTALVRMPICSCTFFHSVVINLRAIKCCFVLNKLVFVHCTAVSLFI